MKFLLFFLLIPFLVFSEDETQTGVLPRDLPPGFEDFSEKPQDSPQEEEVPPKMPYESQDEKRPQEEMPPKMPYESQDEKVSQEQASPKIPQKSSQEVLKTSDQIPASPTNVGTQGSSLQNIYSAPILIEENQVTLEDFTEEYNNVLIEGAPIYQKVQEGSPPKYRFGISAELSPFQSDGSVDLVIVDLSSQFGWIFSNFEVGPFVSVDVEYRIETLSTSSVQELDLIFGGFMEYNFVSRSAQRQFVHPSMGFQVGYNRYLERNSLYVRPYILAKTFVSDSFAISLDLGIDWRKNLNYNSDDFWRVSSNIGFLKYF